MYNGAQPFTLSRMPDPHRDQASLQEPGVLHDARIEELLLAGLDHYFANRHADAINVWTRVLFLDRSHARARAYIERARGAIAECQRESDELLHRGMEAFQEGRSDVARRLLTRAVERGASQQEEALALLGRLDRLEAATFAEPADHEPRARRRRPAVDDRPRVDRPMLWLSIVVCIAAAATIAVLFVTRSGGAPWMALLPLDTPEALATPAQPLPTPQPSDVALVRARAAYTRGRLHDALRALDSIARGGQASTEADQLRTEIQRMLLDAAGAQTPAATPTGNAR
jgi:hypothetical protein